MRVVDHAGMRYGTIPDLLARRAARTPDALAVAGQSPEGTVRVSYGELHRRSGQLAGWLASELRVAPGDPVAWLFDNAMGPEAIVLYHAVLKAGAVNVPISPRLSPFEVDRALRASSCRAIVCDERFAGLLQSPRQVSAQLPREVRTVRRSGPGLAFDDDRAASPCRRLPEPADAGQLAGILETSGTTGRPKGIEHTHASALAAGHGWCQCFRLRREDVVQSPFPITTGAALHFNGLAALWAGAALAVDGTEVESSLAWVAELGTTVFVAVPSIYQYWLEEPSLASRRLATLRLLDAGGARVPPSVVRGLVASVPGAGFVHSYGFTEAGPGGTYLPEEYALEKAGSIGDRPAGAFTEVRVVRQDGTVTDVDEVGELVLRGPSVMRGYHGDPGATSDVMVDGWVRSGDLVVRDGEGFLYFVDRRKDIVIRGGLNISTGEVEDVLLRHPAVVEAAAFALPHDRLGERVGAAVVCRDGRPAEPAALEAHCRQFLATYKVPSVWIVPELPRNATGKVLRRELAGLVGRPRPPTDAG